MHTDPTPPSPVAGPLPAKNTWAGSGGVRWYKSIEFKIILSVAITTLAVNGFFTFLYLDVQARHLDETILKSATRLSETIKKSIQYDMLVNRKENAYRIMETIAEQEGIEKVRIYGREGTILFSTDKVELGTMVDKKAEACYACHAKDTPIEKLSTQSERPPRAPPPAGRSSCSTSCRSCRYRSSPWFPCWCSWGNRSGNSSSGPTGWPGGTWPTSSPSIRTTRWDTSRGRSTI